MHNCTYMHVMYTFMGGHRTLARGGEDISWYKKNFITQFLPKETSHTASYTLIPVVYYI